jgi:hypothetical protein
MVGLSEVVEPEDGRADEDGGDHPPYPARVDRQPVVVDAPWDPHQPVAGGHGSQGDEHGHHADGQLQHREREPAVEQRGGVGVHGEPPGGRGSGRTTT